MTSKMFCKMFFYLTKPEHIRRLYCLIIGKNKLKSLIFVYTKEVSKDK